MKIDGRFESFPYRLTSLITIRCAGCTSVASDIPNCSMRVLRNAEASPIGSHRRHFASFAPALLRPGAIADRPHAHRRPRSALLPSAAAAFRRKGGAHNSTVSFHIQPSIVVEQPQSCSPAFYAPYGTNVT